MSKRTLEYDFAKGVLISLMIIFHLNYFTDAYPQLYKWVYAFHMPGFLILSGYLFNFKKETKDFLKSLRGIVIPYVIFMTLYFVSLNFLGDILGTTNEYKFHSLLGLLKRVAFAPVGTYWFLHTLAICMIVTYCSSKFLNYFKMGGIETIILSGSCLFLLCLLRCGIGWSNILFFVIGMFMRNCNLVLTDNKYSSIISIIPILIITIFNVDYTKTNVAGIGLSLFMLSFLISLYRIAPIRVSKLFILLGRNSLSLVLFSPMLTPISRFYIKVFSFDSTNILWALFTGTWVISICILFSIISDKLKISQFIVGKNLFSKV